MSADNKPRLAFVDAVRGIAASMVCLFHFSNGNTQYLSNSDPLKQLGSYGWTGVEAFFVVSGFVLPWSLMSRSYQLSHFASFIGKRIARIYPPYLASIVLLFALQIVSMLTPGYRGDGKWYISLQGALTHLAFLNGLLGVEWYNPVYWTLAIEMQFYLVLGLLFPLLQSGHWIRPTLLTFCATSLLPITNCWLLHYAAMFGFGMILCFYLNAKFSLMETIFYWLITTLIVGYGNGVTQAIACLVTALVLASAFRRPQLLENRVLLFLGAISYSLYLVHVPVGGRVINLVERLSDVVAVRYLGVLAAFGFSVALAFIFFIVIERPSMRWSSRRAKVVASKS